MAQDWDIKPRGQDCHACQAPFEDQHLIYSSLVFGDEGYARQDCCEACWLAKTAQNPERYSAWKGIYRKPPPPAEETLKKETAESLLRKLVEDQNPARRNVIFILAVMLERKKVLIERAVQVQDGTMTRAYEHRHSGEAFLIVDPRLSLDQLESVQRDVAELLGGQPGAEAPPATEAPPAAVPAEPQTL